MYPRHLFLLLLATISSVISSEVSFKNVNIWTISGEKLASITSAKNLKNHLPKNSTSVLVVTGTIPILFEDSITDIENVEELQFHRNKIVEIRPGAFKNFKNVKALSFIGGNITTIAGVFDNLTLERLNIDSNQMSVIPPGVVKNSRLNGLSFSNNKIKTVEKSAFDHLPNLKELDLSQNLLSDLPPGIFKNLPQLTHVSLDDNKFTTIKEEIFDSSSILHLYLSGNLLKTIPENFMKRMPKLEGIYVIRNHLKEIPSGIFNNKTVQHVELSINDISYIAPNAFDNMPNLTNVFLSTNKLQKYDKRWFHNCPNIQRLFLSNNFLEQLPDQAFKNIYNKKEQWVRLDANKIKKISAETFKGWKRVDILNLSSNEIEAWHENYLADVESIQRLHLISNKIVCPEGDLHKVFKAKTVTYLSHNPLSEECKSKIQEWSAKNGNTVVI